MLGWGMWGIGAAASYEGSCWGEMMHSHGSARGGLNGEIAVEETAAPSSWLQELLALSWHKQGHQYPQSWGPYTRPRGDGEAWYAWALIPSIQFGTSFFQAAWRSNTGLQWKLVRSKRHWIKCLGGWKINMLTQCILFTCKILCLTARWNVQLYSRHQGSLISHMCVGGFVLDSASGIL